MRVIGRQFRRLQYRRALTLVECVWAMVILPLAVTAIALAIVAGQSQAVDALRRTRAAALADALMEEVLALPYDDPSGSVTPGPDAGESNRSQFDNSDDFHGFSETAGNLKDATGTLYPAAYQRFGRSVTCAYTTITVPGLGVATSGLQVTVTVTSGSQQMAVVTRLIAEPSS